MADTYPLTWDASGDRLFEAGVSKGVLYPYNSSTKTYGPGVAWNGLTSLSESPDGAEANDLWADNIKYATLRSAETFGGTIEAYTYPDEFAECDGSASIADGVYLGQQYRKTFGLSYVTSIGDDQHSDIDLGYKLHLVYGCTASPSEKQYESINDSPDAITFSWEFDTTPVAVSGHRAVSTITIDTTKLNEAGKTKLTELETKLYGTGSTAPTLPLPADIVSMFSTT